MKNIFLMVLLTAVCSGFTLGRQEKNKWVRKQTDTLSYWIYTPAVKSTKQGLMINLHGCLQHADDLKNLGNWEDTADNNGWTVVIPDVPDGGVLMGCWAYYGKDQTELNHNNGALIQLAETLIKDTTLNIDPRKVFVSGLSSGAAQALLLGCLRPDLFKGIAVNSGPAIGTDASDIHQAKTTSADVAKFCLELAGKRAPEFSSQVLSLFVGDQDSIVDVAYTSITAEAFHSIYQTASRVSIDLRQLKGPNTSGHGELELDSSSRPRISLIVNQGLGHAWPSGRSATEPTEHFINPNSLNYPAYLASFFNQK
jgi:poly(3-hydroxybutyrate) depolymerase